MARSILDLLLIVVVAGAAYYMGTQTQQPATVLLSTDGRTRFDSNTNIAFPMSHVFPISKPPLSLLAIGTRKKAILNVYSLGVYVSASLSKAISNLDDSKKVCNTLLESKHPKAVQLTFSMSIGPEKVAEAVSQLDGVDKDIVKEFHDLVLNGMGGGKMRSTESMSFEWKGLDVIAVTIRGTVIGEMKDRALAMGVLNLYVGPKSVSPTLRHDLGCV
mmetsp:Transcript_14413/g.23817  ORF Transcript_14413/g.23817 Transcript_14413/m.23817 type:complete len:217 (-) Transcript_14413:211-861(-)|eukprot:CAMPEP_0119013376 /NCGR_PEP_ID=MMETSP1176-20130426/8418_1 /TAXON_ID=265551 /ORGANISM="Synedropsis recta cf, Strain CCMP1620" /LENGTH=216 /DNA_ID=CAMNT_0006966465 /DNA_START=27 /DNA_END=677 /DNA_ORIENTATION=+